MINVAVLGYGVVGSGVVEVIEKNKNSIMRKAGEEIKVKYIVDLKEIPEPPAGTKVITNGQDAIDDPEISVIVETIGGIGFAYQFTKTALLAGKHVVTSNKELVATHGPELLDIARANNVNYLFEASVGGGIPIIRPLNQCLAANEIHGIVGILNGTTNYILTKMYKEGMDFNTALKSAQENGYAEANPTADIEGHDTCRKIAILSSISYGQYVDYKVIPTEGITKITLEDMKYADEMNCVIKLLAISREEEGKIFARVCPAMIERSHPLANVEDVFNGILVQGNAIGDVMFYGRGAGKLPTASAVVADIIDIVKHIDSNNRSAWKVVGSNSMMDPSEDKIKFFIRLKIKDMQQAVKSVAALFGKVEKITAGFDGAEEELAFVTASFTEKHHQKVIEGLKSADGVEAVTGTIRVLEEN